MHIIKYYYSFILFVIIHSTTVLAGGFPHFYIPPTILEVPRLDRNLLSSIDIQLINTTTKHRFSSKGHSIPLFNPLAGPCINLNESADKFELIGATLTITQNLFYSIFLEVGIPYFSITTTHTQSHHLALYNSLSQWNKSGPGDIYMGIGWSHSFINCPNADFIDICIKADLIFPTAPGSQPLIPCSIPLGYDKHQGFLLSFSSDIGYFDWLTIGWSANGIIFANHNNKHLSPLTWINLFIIADHCARGLSLTLGYAYTTQSRGSLPPCTPPGISNIAYKGWHAHILHFCAEYDFSCHSSCIGKRISFTHQIPVKGKRVFLSSPWEVAIGLDLDWN